MYDSCFVNVPTNEITPMCINCYDFCSIILWYYSHVFYSSITPNRNGFKYATINNVRFSFESASFYCYEEYEQLKNQTTPKSFDTNPLDWEGWMQLFAESADLWMILCIFSGGICFTVCCFVAMTYNRIAATIDVVRVGSK